MSDTSLMQAFFDSTDAFIYIKDAEGRFLLVNKTGADALKLSEADCVGKTAHDVLPQEDADRTTEIDRQVRETNTPANFKDVVNLPSGQRTLLDHKFPIAIPDQPDAIAGVAIDITDVV